MDESTHGSRDASGQFQPKNPISYGPLFAWPPRPIPLLKWLTGLPGYILPWNLILTAIGALILFAFIPPMAQMKTLQIGWIAQIAVICYVALILWCSAWHVWLYILRRQDTRFKYNPAWPKTESAVFIFGSQNADNIFWSLISGVPIWTAYIVVALYLYANGYVAWCDPALHPIWFTLLLFLIPLIGELHFFAVHRLIHFPFLYKHVHSLHHKNTNPAPWSGLSMHPVEHLLYFSGILMVAAIYSHPIHMLSYAVRVGLGPAIGHTGFDKVELGGERSVDAGIYAHYLHHKLFEVNYADGAIPLDKWFGSFHDGSPEGDAMLRARLKKRIAARRAKAKQHS